MKALTPEEQTYLRNAGFVISTTECAVRRYNPSGPFRLSHAMTLVPSNPKDPHCPWYWTVLSASQDENTAMELVVSSSEQITDVTVAFVTAEVRGWRRI